MNESASDAYCFIVAEPHRGMIKAPHGQEGWGNLQPWVRSYPGNWDGRMKLDDILWSISWSAELTPDLSMIPNRSVFLYVPQIKAPSIQEGIESSLLSASAAFFECLLTSNTQVGKEGAEDVPEQRPTLAATNGLGKVDKDSYAIA